MGLGSHSKIVLKLVDFQVKLYATTTSVVPLNNRKTTIITWTQHMISRWWYKTSSHPPKITINFIPIFFPTKKASLLNYQDKKDFQVFIFLIKVFEVPHGKIYLVI